MDVEDEDVNRTFTLNIGALPLNEKTCFERIHTRLSMGLNS